MKPLFALALLGLVAGCNTVEGLGRDLAAGGAAIEEASEDARRPRPQPVYTTPAPATTY